MRLITAWFPSIATSSLRADFCDEISEPELLEASTFCDCFAYGFNTTAPPPLDNTTGSIFQAVKGGQSLIKLTPSLLFFAIVDVVEAEVGR